MHALDTDPVVAEMMLERTRRLTPHQRMLELERACALTRQFMRAGIRSRHPEYDDEQVERALVRLLWGDELYRQARPDWPLLDP